MTRIVKDLLTLSSLDEEQGVPKRTENIDLKVFVKDIVDRMKINADKKNQTLTFTVVNDTPVFMSCLLYTSRCV